MKFQNISISPSKVMLCTRKRDKRMNKQTDKPEAICPPLFFKVWGHKKYIYPIAYFCAGLYHMYFHGILHMPRASGIGHNYH